MHDYAILNHNRANIGRWLGLCSLFLSFVISIGLLKLSTISFFNNLTSFTVSSGILYLSIYSLFNKILWKIEWFKLPNIQGVWNVEGETLNQENEIIHKWAGYLDIEQTWDKIVIVLKTEHSNSESYIATLRKESGSKGGWILSYSYKNEPNIDEQQDLSIHKGFCEIIFPGSMNTANGTYFNNFGRFTFGKITLNREE